MFSLSSPVHPSIWRSVDLFYRKEWQIDFLIHPSLHLCLASSFMFTFPATSPIILEALDVTVGLQWWEEDVEEPQADEQHGGQDFWCPGPAQLSADLWPPSVHQRGNTYKGKDGKECDGEGQCAWIHLEVTALGIVVDGSDGPSHLSDISEASQNDTKMTLRTWHTWQKHMRDSPRCPGTRLQHWSRSRYRWRRQRTDPGWQPPYWQKYLGRHRSLLSRQCSVDTPRNVLGDITQQGYIFASVHLWQMKQQPRRYFFSDKADDSCECEQSEQRECHWPDPAMDWWG